MINTQAIVHMLKRRITTEQLCDILEDMRSAHLNGEACIICEEPAIPVDTEGKETEEDTLVVGYQQNHSRDCLVPLIENVLGEGEPNTSNQK